MRAHVAFPFGEDANVFLDMGMSWREMPEAERQTPSSEVRQGHANERISASGTSLLPRPIGSGGWVQMD